MENRFDKDMQDENRKTENMEAGVRPGELDDEALSQAAGGGRYTPSMNQRCHYCGRTGGSMTQKTITLWQGNIYGYGKSYDVWVCSNCRSSGQRSPWEKPFI